MPNNYTNVLYVFDGADGSQVALWTCKADRVSSEHAHDFERQDVLVEEEARQGVEVSQPLYEEFHGVALAWAQGATLKEIAVRSRIAEGDLVGHFLLCCEHAHHRLLSLADVAQFFHEKT